MRTMTARYSSRCRNCGGRIEEGDTIRWSRSTGAIHGSQSECDDFAAFAAEEAGEARFFAGVTGGDRNAEMRGFTDGPFEDWEAAERRRDEREYRRGVAEVAQIQAFAPAGSALREAMYLEMEQAAWNRGEDY